MSLSAEDKAALDDSWDFGPFGGLEHQYAAVEQIVARHTAAAVAAFKAEAVAVIEGRYAFATTTEPHDPLPTEYIGAERNGWLSGLKDAARWVNNLP